MIWPLCPHRYVEPLVDMTQSLGHQQREAGARGRADLLGIDVTDDGVGDLAAEVRAHRPIQRRVIGRIGGMLGKENDGILRLGVATAQVVHSQAMGEIRVPRDNAPIGNHVAVPVHCPGPLRARGPLWIARVRSDLIENPLGVVVCRVEELVERPRDRQILTPRAAKR